MRTARLGGGVLLWTLACAWAGAAAAATSRFTCDLTSIGEGARIVERISLWPPGTECTARLAGGDARVQSEHGVTEFWLLAALILAVALLARHERLRPTRAPLFVASTAVAVCLAGYAVSENLVAAGAVALVSALVTHAVRARGSSYDAGWSSSVAAALGGVLGASYVLLGEHPGWAFPAGVVAGVGCALSAQALTPARRRSRRRAAAR